MLRGPGERIAGFVPFKNEMILSGIFQKKVITVNYDFPGYTVMCAPNEATATNPLAGNQIFYRETTSPGKYAPLVLVMVHAWATTTLDIFNNDTGKLGTGSAAKISLWDNSASAWSSGATYVSAYGAADSAGSGYVRCTTSACEGTPEADADAICAGIDAGVAGMIDYVIVDQEIDLRASAKPDAISADFTMDAVYVARINQRMLSGYDVFPTNFVATLKAANQRLILDRPQI